MARPSDNPMRNEGDYLPGGFRIVSPNHLKPTLFDGARARTASVPFLPTTRQEMEALGWTECDVIVVTGDAYIDHPSFGMALVGRLLEALGYRVGILSQPDWRSVDPYRALGRPRLFFGITAGNMDSMVNRFTADRKIRRDDAYSPDGQGGLRPDRSVNAYAQRCREAYAGVPIVIGGIEASLRRAAHYDYWGENVRRSAILDAKADLLVYGNGERQIAEIARRLDAGEAISAITDIRGTALLRKTGVLLPGFSEIDSSSLDQPGRIDRHIDPYSMDTPGGPGCDVPAPDSIPVSRLRKGPDRADRAHSVVRMPSFEAVRDDKVLYAHASRVLHQELNPGNARALVQQHGDRDVWMNPPPLPLTTAEMDDVYDLPYRRIPHPGYRGARIPAYEMIQNSVTIMRGCFGGCTFCSITEHEGRIIQNRSADSVLREIEAIRDTSPGFTGVISDIGGPTANMYRLACKDPKVEAACRLPSCVYPGVCENLNTDHGHLIDLYRRARALPGIKKVLVASGVRYDLAVESPEYIKELATHHVGGYLKIAPEHTEDGPLSKMLKPGIGSYEKFRKLFEKYTKEAGKKQYLIPYFIAAHPGTSETDMAHLALWLKKNGFRPDQVQTFLPTPMATASAMYHTGKNPLKKVSRVSETVEVPKELKLRQIHKAFLRYHDPDNWPVLRQALRRLGLSAWIGSGPNCLVPAEPVLHGYKKAKFEAAERARKRSRGAPLRKAK
jgi:uncharacterized radical SAM protein YgiQ